MQPLLIGSTIAAAELLVAISWVVEASKLHGFETVFKLICAFVLIAAALVTFAAFVREWER